MGNHVREGSGETRPRTELAWENLGPPGARRIVAGSGAVQRAGESETAPPPVRGPLPTRVTDLPPLPAEYEDVLREGLAAIPGPPLTAAARTAIDDHVRLLLAWNSSINLSGIRSPDGTAREHVLDSLTALPLLRRAGISEFVDLGSGGGFPGLPLAAALPAERALLVESVAKKARFLQVALAAAGLSDTVGVAAVRAESLAADQRHRGRWQAVVARAVADLTELAELSLPLLAVGGMLVAWKREPLDDELSHAERAVRQFGGRLVACEPVTVPGLTDHVLAVVEKVASTPPEFPRDPAARKRRPL
jgi:16S rRNA (guanine527-N7)-methyltransferase